jgi:hypothetical protein
MKKILMLLALLGTMGAVQLQAVIVDSIQATGGRKATATFIHQDTSRLPDQMSGRMVRIKQGDESKVYPTTVSGEVAHDHFINFDTPGDAIELYDAKFQGNQYKVVTVIGQNGSVVVLPSKWSERKDQKSIGSVIEPSEKDKRTHATFTLLIDGERISLVGNRRKW